ncbi:Cytochrome c oxidase polypeptide VIII, mitochondrial [Candida viswanathii]|uniref:Cytochrome c oxidase subunit 8, mitochondrial n=1 Tax=Candida viswanathii TaxID=5486 RepID=A0A367XND2_9ASCO|nr:Cytochrome c oxidase polypeptide VIII, mitochondrial [Candida viswanathii]
MFAQSALRSSRALPSRILTRRNFQVSSKRLEDINTIVYGHPQEGVYSNLPFKVKNRKFIPFAVYYWGVLGFFFAFPFLTSWWQLKKSGAFNQTEE